MSDFLVDLGARPTARKIIKAMGLPIPMPQKLKRDHTPWRQQELEGLPVVFAQLGHSTTTRFAAHALAAAGAETFLAGDDKLIAAFKKEGEAWGRLPRAFQPDEQSAAKKPHALVFDATAIEKPEQLKQVYDFYHHNVRSLAACGRVLILAPSPAATKNPLAAAAARALVGFTKSAGREIGKKGATANLLFVDPGAEERIEPLLRFLLSYRSAYVSGQQLTVSNAVVGTKPESFQRPLDGKTALVTGAARGIGAAIARAFAREGARVIVLDRPADDGPASVLAGEVKGSLLLCDITDADAPKIIADYVKKQFGGLDIVVHNAGVTRDKMLQNMDEERWDTTLNVNLVRMMAVNEKLLPRMNAGGRIVFLSSIAGIAGNVGQTNYAASKAGVIGYVEALAPTLAPKGIAVNAVAPGFIETRLTAAIPVATREVARRLANLGQGGLPEDVAEVITYLAGPGAWSLSGQIWRICGGNYVGA
ncbi:MAG: 3-oxoacyl-ACP reductase [Candidatus Lernaella stagnicola]|nr:3-oxoacyl-ACP reductase [Candidatus Lernaella stagnicola]